MIRTVVACLTEMVPPRNRSDAFLKTYYLFVLLMRVTPVETEHGSAGDLDGDAPAGRPMAALASGQPGSNRNTEHGGRTQLGGCRSSEGEEGGGFAAAALISPAVDVQLLLGSNCNQRDSLV